MPWPTKKLGEVLKDKDDVIGFMFSSVGALLVAFSVGALNGGGDTGGYAFAYITHPIWLRLGLVLIVIGFVFQLADSLISRHKIDANKVHCAISVIIGILIPLAILL